MRVSFAYQPSDITVPRGPVRFVISNGAGVEHGFEVEGPGVEARIACLVDDHRQRGMTGTLTAQ